MRVKVFTIKLLCDYCQSEQSAGQGVTVRWNPKEAEFNYCSCACFTRAMFDLTEKSSDVGGTAAMRHMVDSQGVAVHAQEFTGK